jgi:hypothetical protein
MACAQAFGLWPTDIKDVNISDSGSARTGASFLNNTGGKPSGPLEFVFFSFLIAAKTRAGEKLTVLIVAKSGTNRSITGVVPLSAAQAVPKKSFNKLARSSSLTSNVLPFLLRRAPMPLFEYILLLTNL